MAKKKSTKTDQTEAQDEAQDKAAEDLPAPEISAAEPDSTDTETPVSDTLDDTQEPAADGDAPETAAPLDETDTPPEQAAASEPEPLDTPEAEPQNTPTEPETAPDEIGLAPDDDPSAEIATLTEAEAAQEDQDKTDQSDTSAPLTKTEQVTIRQGGFWSMLFGGVVAAGIGVIAAPYVLPENLLTQGEDRFDPTQLQERIAAQESALSDVQSTLKDLTPAPDLSDEVSTLRETLTGLAEQVSDIESRVTALEDRPAAAPGNSDVSAAQIDELSAALDAQRKTLNAQRAEIDALKNEATAQEAAARDSARATLQRAALTRVMTALDTGDEFETALADLRETGVDVPKALADVAKTGVPTQSALFESFPQAARAALATVRAADGGAASSVGDFFKSQLGIRSLEPRAGDDPDAVLSRAEAALRDGRLGDALAEIETLPDGARAAMSDWTEQARLRSAALSAADTLAGTLN